MNRMLVGTAALALIGLAGCGSTAGKSSTAAPSTGSSTPTPSCDATCQAIRSEEASAAAAPTSSTYMTPTPADFTVTLKILSKQCFGSAGCNIEYQPKLSTDLASGLLDPTVTYDVTYVVRGDVSGPITDTITVTGDQYDEPDSNVAQTPSQHTRLIATVTGVSPE